VDFQLGLKAFLKNRSQELVKNANQSERRHVSIVELPFFPDGKLLTNIF